MNEQELMKFVIERSNDPVIKNPVLRDAMNKDLGPRNMYNQGSSVDHAVRTIDPVQDSGNKIEEVLKAYGIYQGNRKGGRMSFKKFFELFATENFAEGGRTGFFKAGLVKQGSNAGKWSVPDFDENSRQTVFFESEELANKAIADRKIKTSRYEKSRKILNDPKLKKEFIKYGNGKDVTGKMIREKYGLANEEFFEGGLRDLFDKDFKKFSEGGIKQKTINNMLLLHYNNLSKNYITKGLIIPNDIIEKLGLNSSEAATATTRLSQHYGGFDFGFDELKNIRRNANASNKLFEAMNKFAFGNPYRSSLYSTSLELIDKQLGNERGTFSSLKNKARKILKANKIKGFDINEIAGVTGTAKSGVGEFSQFMDVMDSNLNQKEMASFQSAFSRARQDIKNNPKNFATQSKQINKLAANFERRYGVKLPRIRNAADVEKYYSPKRLQELKDQGLDIKKASKKLKYTIQMPAGASTINEFVNDPKKQKKIVEKIKSGTPLHNKLMKFCPKDVGGTAGVCSLDEAMRGMKEESKMLKSGKLNKPQAEQIAKKFNAVRRVGTGLAKGSKLMSWLGPYGLGGEIALEGMFLANDMLENGMTYKEALSNSVLRYALPKNQREKLEYNEDRNRKILGNDTKGLAADYVSGLKKQEDLIKSYNKFNKMNETEGVGDIDGSDIYDYKDIYKAEKDFGKDYDRMSPTYGKNIFDIVKYGSPEQQAFAAKEEGFDVRAMENRMEYDKKLLGPLGKEDFYSQAQLDMLDAKALSESKKIGQRSNEIKTQEVANFGGVANRAEGGIMGIKRK